MTGTETVGVYIITHNRLNTLIRSLESVMNQDFKDFTIVVSDNSDNDETMLAMQKYVESNPRIRYIRQTDAPSGIDHINKVLKNNTFDYFMMFHDDDEMLPNMVGTLHRALLDDPGACAVSSDYYVNDYGRLLTKNNVGVSAKIFSVDDLVRGYSALRSPAFPGYMYKSNKIKGIFIDFKEGGKYSDVSFLVKIAERGYIKYLPECLMIYYKTSLQDSAQHDFTNYLYLFSFLKKHLDNNRIMIPMRIKNIYNQLELIQKQIGSIPVKSSCLSLFLYYSPINFFPKYVLRILGYGNRK